VSEPPDTAAPTEGESSGPSKLRLALLVVFLVGLFVLGSATGWADRFTLEGVRDTIADAGAWGFAIFLAVFAIGELLHVPGFLFVAAAVLAYGRLVGGVAAYAGAIVSVVVSFAVVRGVGGKALGGLMQAALALDEDIDLALRWQRCLTQAI